MPTLTINYNQLSYAGTFVKPAFDLLSGKIAGGGLFDVFTPFGIALHSISEEGLISNPSTVAINVYLANLGNYKLKLDGVEWKVINFGEEVIPKFPEVLQASSAWLRASVANFSFKNHVFIYNAHCALPKGNSKEFLLGLGYKSPLILGEELGNGLIHNWFSAELGASIQFMLDRSTPVKGGLFVQFIVVIEGDQIDYQVVSEKGYGILLTELKALGLEFEGEQEVKS
jgi:hypothetical protein